MANKISAILYWLLALTAAAVFYMKNNANWDIIPYSAMIRQLEVPQANGKQIHDETYAAVKRELSGDAFRLLADSSNRYRRNTLNDAGFFEDQLCYYQVKPGFNLLNFLSKKLTGQYTKAIALTSVIGWLLVALVLPLWLRQGLTVPWAYFLSICLLLLPFMVEAARTASPDMISSAFLLWALYSVYRGNYMPAMILAVLSIFIRPDNNIATGCLIVYIWVDFAIRRARIWGIVMMIVAVVLTLWLATMCTSFTIKTAMYDGGYFAHVFSALKGVGYSFLPIFFIFLVILFATGVFTFRNQAGRFALLMLIIEVGKFAVVPTTENRFYIPFLLGQLIVSAIAIAEYGKSKEISA